MPPLHVLSMLVSIVSLTVTVRDASTAGVSQTSGRYFGEMYAQCGDGPSTHAMSHAWVVSSPVALHVSTTRSPHFTVFGTHETDVQPSTGSQP